MVPTPPPDGVPGSTLAAILEAARLIAGADALLITAGAGMSVDSGLPDFRGPEGFWRAFPPAARLGLEFAELATPRWFLEDPDLAWSFYGWRLMQYRAAVPHHGYELLRRWSAARTHESFVFTSNVDGLFAKAGFPAGRLVECHGSIHWLQCVGSCNDDLFPADGLNLDIGPDLQLRSPVPRCPRCNAVARPNVLMFSDADWLWDRTDEQQERLDAWLEALPAAARRTLVVVECGAGTDLPKVRRKGEEVAAWSGGSLVRINPRAPQGRGPGFVGIPLPALSALRQIGAGLDVLLGTGRRASE